MYQGLPVKAEDAQGVAPADQRTTDPARDSAQSMPSQGVDLRADGLEAMLDALPGVFPESDGDIELRDGRLGEELVEIGLVSVWGSLWAREGLGKRERSLVTLGILIALGAESELRTHVRIALTNGITKDEIAEVIYHAAGYAGFPAATAARTAAREALGE